MVFLGKFTMAHTLKSFIKTIETKNNQERRNQIIYKLEQIKCPYHIQEYLFKNSEEHGYNIIVKMGSNKKKIIIGAHYDIAQGSAGANDNGSGVSVLLGVIQKITENKSRFNHTIEAIFFDHEETPESGARHYVENCQTRDIVGMYNLDTCGMGDTIIFDDKRNSDKPIVQSVRDALEHLQYPYSLMHELPSSDERQFEEAGIPNIQIAAIPQADISIVSKLVTAQKQLRASIADDSITPREADQTIKQILGTESLPRLLSVMHTPDDLAIHISEKTLNMVLNVIFEAVLRYDKNCI
jgi:aminopeptidase YwaD